MAERKRVFLTDGTGRYVYEDELPRSVRKDILKVGPVRHISANKVPSRVQKRGRQLYGGARSITGALGNIARDLGGTPDIPLPRGAGQNITQRDQAAGTQRNAVSDIAGRALGPDRPNTSTENRSVDAIARDLAGPEARRNAPDGRDSVERGADIASGLDQDVAEEITEAIPEGTERVPGLGGPGGTSHRYDEEDVNRPNTWPQERVAELQREMVRAGLLQSEFRMGVYDGATREAYQQLLLYSDGQDVEATKGLKDLKTQWSEQKHQALQSMPLEPYRPPNPDAQRRQARSYLERRFERTVHDWEVDRLQELAADVDREAYDADADAAREQGRVELENQERQLLGEDPMEADPSEMEQVDPEATFEERANRWYQYEEDYRRDAESNRGVYDQLQMGFGAMRGAVR